MIRLPRLDRPEQARILANYHSALQQRSLKLFGNERKNHALEIEAAFALGLTCGLALAAESAAHASAGGHNADN